MVVLFVNLDYHGNCCKCATPTKITSLIAMSVEKTLRKAKESKLLEYSRSDYWVTRMELLSAVPLVHAVLTVHWPFILEG